LAARFDDLRAAARENTEQSTEAAITAIDELLMRVR
jgi:hypothetical protein